jgi:hypothetical protein
MSRARGPSMSAAFLWRVMLRRKQWADRYERLMSESTIDPESVPAEKLAHAKNMVAAYEAVLTDQGQWMVHEVEAWLKAETEYGEASP